MTRWEQQTYCPLTFDEVDEMRNSIHVGDLFEIPIYVTKDVGALLDEQRPEWCIVDAVYPNIVVFQRYNGMKTSMTIKELCILSRQKYETEYIKKEMDKQAG